MNHDPLLWRQVILKAGLAASSLLNFLRKCQRIEIQKLKHFLGLSLLDLGESEESRFEPMGDYQSHSTETCILDSFTARDQVLTEDGACKRDVAQDLAMDQVGLVHLVAREVEDDLTGGLDVGDDSLVRLERLVTGWRQIWHLRVRQQMPDERVDMITVFE